MTGDFDDQPPSPPQPTPLVVAYNPTWPQAFETARARILQAVGPHVQTVEHVGSTSVVGLCAKPIIDILVGVRDWDEARVTIAPLEPVGWEFRGQRGNPPPPLFRHTPPRRQPHPPPPHARTHLTPTTPTCSPSATTSAPTPTRRPNTQSQTHPRHSPRIPARRLPAGQGAVHSASPLRMPESGPTGTCGNPFHIHPTRPITLDPRRRRPTATATRISPAASRLHTGSACIVLALFRASRVFASRVRGPRLLVIGSFGSFQFAPGTVPTTLVVWGFRSELEGDYRL